MKNYISMGDIGTYFNKNVFEIKKIFLKLKWIEQDGNKTKLTQAGIINGGKKEKITIMWNKDILQNKILLEELEYKKNENIIHFRLKAKKEKDTVNKEYATNKIVPKFVWVAITILIITIAFVIFDKNQQEKKIYEEVKKGLKPYDKELQKTFKNMNETQEKILKMF